MIDYYDEYNAKAWGHKSILNYFDKNRMTTKDIYQSELLFLKQNLHNDMSVLDIGCAKGGFAGILSEHIKNFTYVGVDINQQMINEAKIRYPQHTFYKVLESDYTILGNQRFDLVLCLGILHLHENWRDTLSTAWSHTKNNLLIDLRETHLSSIENKNISYFKMDFDDPSNSTSDYILPYNIINVAEAQQIIFNTCTDANKVMHYGYTHPISEFAVSPIKNVMANVYCIEKCQMPTEARKIKDENIRRGSS